MDYIKIYYDIINNAKLRGLDKGKFEGYFEKHHIIPCCYFKSRKIATYKENLVLLTGEEHIICHHLLWKSELSNSSLMQSYHCMLHQKRECQDRQIKLTPKQFDLLRLKHSEYSKKRMTGINNSFYGKTHTEETRKKMSLKRIGLKHSEETKLKQSKQKLGKIRSEEAKQNMRHPHKPHKISISTKMVKINNVVYETATIAAKYLNCSSRTIRNRCRDLTNLNYKYIDRLNEGA